MLHINLIHSLSIFDLMYRTPLLRRKFVQLGHAAKEYDTKFELPSNSSFYLLSFGLMSTTFSFPLRTFTLRLWNFLSTQKRRRKAHRQQKHWKYQLQLTDDSKMSSNNFFQEKNSLDIYKLCNFGVIRTRTSAVCDHLRAHNIRTLSLT
jgi:hypothetical protein